MTLESEKTWVTRVFIESKASLARPRDLEAQVGAWLAALRAVFTYPKLEQGL